MTGPSIPPSDPRPDRPAERPYLAGQSANGPLVSQLAVPAPLGGIPIGRILLYIAGAVVLLFTAKAVLYHDPVSEMTEELYRVGTAETTYRGTHPRYSASLAELQQQDRNIKLHSQLVQFEAGANGYEMVVRHSNTDQQCTLLAGSFKALGGEPEVTCTHVAPPK
jgi:hypothetical protein